MARTRSPFGLLAALCVATALGPSALAGDPPAGDAVPAGAAALPAAPLPFAALAARLHLGTPTAVGTLVVIPVWAAELPPSAAPAAKGPGAWVGLLGSDAAVLELPPPVGAGVVRVANPLAVPLLLPRGEALAAPL